MTKRYMVVGKDRHPVSVDLSKAEAEAELQWFKSQTSAYLLNIMVQGPFRIVRDIVAEEI